MSRPTRLGENGRGLSRGDSFPRPPSSSSYGEDTSLRVDQLTHKVPTPSFVYLLTGFSAIGGFLFGYDTGVISGAMMLLRERFVLSSVWQELVVSMTIAAAAGFALVGGHLNDRLGRKPVILLASMVFTLGALGLALAEDKYMLLLGRIVVGIGIGLTSTTTPMYIAEAAPASIRGRLVSCNIAMVACGQCVANVVDGIFSLVGPEGWRYLLPRGLSSMTVPMYVAESSPKHLRGPLVMTNTLMVAAGQAAAAVVDGLFGRYKHNGWRYMLGLGGVPALLQFVAFVFMPESPRWLIDKGQTDKARMVLQKIRGQADIEEEFDNIQRSCAQTEQEMESRRHTPIIWQMLQTPAVRRALFIGCSLQMFQQVAGINTVMYYSATIIKISGVKSEEAAIWLSAVTAAVNFLFTFLGLYLVEKIGRRPLTIGSLIGAVVSLAWLAVGFNLSAVNSPEITLREEANLHSKCDGYDTCYNCMMDLYCGYCYMDGSAGAYNGSCLPSEYNNPLASTLGRCNHTGLRGQLTWAYDYCPTTFAWMPMVGLVLYLVFFAPGMGPMPWTINSEIYPLWARSTGNAAATFTNWVFNLAVSMSFLSLTETLTRYGTFWLYACLAAIGVVFLIFFLPETKGKSLEEVEGLFARPWFGSEGQPVPFGEKSVQYVHIRGLNRDGRESELDSPE